MREPLLRILKNGLWMIQHGPVACDTVDKRETETKWDKVIGGEKILMM
jgi:hypothetical protein